MPDNQIASSKFVTYIGSAHVREIGVEGWRDSNVTDMNKTCRWHKGNGWSIPADEFSDSAMAYFDTDHEFVVKDVEVPRVD